MKILTGKPTAKRPQGKSRHRWEDNISMNLQESGSNMRNWIDSVQDRDYWSLMNAALNLQIHNPCSSTLLLLLLLLLLLFLFLNY